MLKVVYISPIDGRLDEVLCDWVDFNENSGVTYCHWNNDGNVIMLDSDSVREITVVQ